MNEDSKFSSPSPSQRANEIAQKWGLQEKKPKRGTLEKIVLIGGVFAAATCGTICAMRPTDYDRIRELPVAEYIIRPGDTFHSLSERFVLDQHKYSKGTITAAVIDMNPGKDPAKLRPGTVVYLPVDSMPPEQVAALGGRLQ